MTTDSSRLRVLCRPGADPATWSDVIATTTAIAGLDNPEAPIVLDDGSPQAVLAAAGRDMPVVVLPPAVADRTNTHRLRVVLVPSDRSRSERRVLQEWIGRAEQRGLDVRQIHVLTKPTRPVMWEGPGHHAEAWWEEARLRHGVRTGRLSMSSGDPASSILEEAEQSDLVILFWRGRIPPGRAAVLRRVIDHSSRPLLLVQGAPSGTRGSIGDGSSRFADYADSNSRMAR